MRIELRDVTKKYGSLSALANVSMEIAPGQLVALLGPNGAGKTTLLRLLAGIVAPTRGEVLYDGERFNRGRMDFRERLHFLPDFPFVFERWTSLQHIGMMLRLYKADGPGIEEKVIELLSEFELLPLAERPLQVLSRGQRYKAALVAMIAADPELWLVDEPFASGMDPHGISAFKRRSREATARGRTVIYSTQILDAAERFSDRAGIIYRGELVAFDSVANMHDPSFTQGGVLEGMFELLRQKARARLRKSREDWREFKRYRWWRQPVNLPAWLIRGAPPLLAAWVIAIAGLSAKTLMAAAFFWSLATLSWRAGQLLVALKSSARLMAFAHLPLSDAQIFQYQWRWFLRTCGWSIVDFTAWYGLLALQTGFGINAPLMGFVLALLQYGVTVSLAAWFYLFVPKRHLLRITTVFVAMALGVFFIPEYRPIVSAIASASNWLPPMGWISYVIGIVPPRNPLLELWPAVSLAAVLLSLPLAYRKLRDNYAVPEGLLEGERERGTVEAARRASDDGETADANAGIKAAIRTRAFLSESNWAKAGLIERLMARWLTPRDRVATEFLVGGTPRWTTPLYKAVLLSALVTGLFILVPSLFNVLPFFVIFGGFSLLGKALGGLWPGMALREIGGSNIGLNSIYPIGFWQITRVSLKVYLMQLLLLLALAAAPGAAALYVTQVNLLSTAGFAVRLMVLVLAMLTLTPVSLVSKGTNDGDRTRVVLCLILFVILAGPTCVALFVASSLIWVIYWTVCLLAIFVAGLWFYGHAYNHNWFDLQSRPKEQKPLIPRQ